MKSLGSLKAAAIVTLASFLSACVTLVEPDTPGQSGKITQNGKEVVGVLYRIHAPWAEACTVNGQQAWQKREGGYHDFLFTPGTWSNPSFLRITCNTTTLTGSRQIATVFDEQGFRSARTGSTIGAALVSGPLALITGPAVAEMTKDTFKFPPILIHVPDLAIVSPDMDAQREAAVTRWAALGEVVTAECSRRGGDTKVFTYACDQQFYALLRAEDLKAFIATR
ncbi:MAG: hypothetical protein O9270_08595 [Aquidulcibacter sp.]|jgi:hypothetical protein|uniref:hypothetical protein n=1 Tax=Aquidulcibacter sp. TaxID=2052990 RepID=UPI0022C907AA|nr:hypothetical protein [Aquidulcibacter sp.]MCE2889840.1 hypothetical protein [Hyphomonadaceae bacterium]MCZ8208240.1 hypothetical protein [Aquidulcibacter sp.]